MSIHTPRSDYDQEKNGSNGTDNVKQELLFNLESYTPAQKEKLKTAIQHVFNGIYTDMPEKPFHTIKIEDTDGLSAYLDTMLTLFSGGEQQRQSAKKQIQIFIETGKRNALADNGVAVDRILFFYKHDMHNFMVESDFGDAINKENNIDMRDEEGNGGIEDKIEFPGAFDNPDAGTFALINATEDRIKKRPNAIMIVITKNLRTKFRWLMHQYYHNGVVKYYDHDVEQARNATDKEVWDRYAVPDMS